MVPCDHRPTKRSPMNLLVAASGSGGLNPAVTIIIILAVVALYWVPTIVGAIRHVPNIGSVAVANFFGFALGIGWVIALAMAVRSKPAPQYLYAPPPPGTSNPQGR